MKNKRRMLKGIKQKYDDCIQNDDTLADEGVGNKDMEGVIFYFEERKQIFCSEQAKENKIKQSRSIYCYFYVMSTLAIVLSPTIAR